MARAKKLAALPPRLPMARVSRHSNCASSSWPLAQNACIFREGLCIAASMRLQSHQKSRTCLFSRPSPPTATPTDWLPCYVSNPSDEIPIFTDYFQRSLTYDLSRSALRRLRHTAVATFAQILPQAICRSDRKRKPVSGLGAPLYRRGVCRSAGGDGGSLPLHRDRSTGG